MSISRWREWDQQINSHPVVTLTYIGSQGSASGRRTWALEDTFRDGAIADINSNLVDVVDHWPKSGEFDVYVDGILQIPTVDYTTTVHQGTTGFSITFTKDIADASYVQFKL